MSGVFFMADLHFGQRSIMEFEGKNRAGKTYEENMHSLICTCNSVVSKRDVLWLLGDVAFSSEGLAAIKEIKCDKKLVLGNHDVFPLKAYQNVFSEICGLRKRYGFWLSHAPIHPSELRGKKNIHGHVHSRSLDDDRYVNVCVENLDGFPISLDKIRNMGNSYG